MERKQKYAGEAGRMTWLNRYVNLWWLAAFTLGGVVGARIAADKIDWLTFVLALYWFVLVERGAR